MNKKIILAVVLVIITVTCAFSLTACNGNIVYEVGDYGYFDEFGNIQEHEGYKFIGWDKSGKQGLKKVYKAQYERIEFYLPEVKDVYECAQDTFVFFTINYKITNMQTMETIDTGVVGLPKYTTSDPNMHIGWFGDGEVGVTREPKEFDVILTLTAEDTEYNIKQDFNLHLVRNRIKVESINIKTAGVSGSTVAVDGVNYLYANEILPENASFKSIKYTVLEVVRNGVNLTAEEQAQIAYFDDDDLYTTDKAQVGDVIRVQAYNERDPEVKSNILTIFVTED